MTKNYIYIVLFLLLNLQVLCQENQLYERINAERCYSQKQANFENQCTTNKENRQFQHSNFGKSVDQMTLDEYQVKGSHNSYQSPVAIEKQLKFNNNYPYMGGVLNIEFDIIIDPQSIKRDVLTVKQFQDQHQRILEQQQQQFENLENFENNDMDQESDEEEIFNTEKIVTKKEKILNLKQQIWSKQTTNWEFGLQHDGPFNKNAQTLRNQLINLKLWSDENGGSHLPVFIHIDLKHDAAVYGSDEEFTKQLDNQIIDCLGSEKLIIPQDILQYGKYDNLLDAIQQEGFPKIQNILGKFIFIMTGSESDIKVKQRRQYYNSDPSKRILFLDIDQRLVKMYPLQKYLEKERNRIIFNSAADNQSWQSQIIEAKKQKLLTRVYFVNDEYLWDICVELGVNIIATDHLYYTPWSCF